MRNWANTSIGAATIIIASILGSEIILALYLEEFLMAQFKLSGIILEYVDITTEVIAMSSLLYFLVFRRITKGAAEMLATQNKLKTTLEAIPDLLFEVGLDGTYYDYHSPRTDLLAVPAEVFLGKKISDIVPADVAEICMSAIHEANEKGWSTGKQYELELPQGKRWFELSVSRKPNELGQEPRFIVLSRDITWRKSAEVKIKRQSNLYATLSQCNKAIVYSNNKEELFTQVCHAVVESSGFKMAWVGLVDEESKQILPVASYGDTSGYLENIRVSMDGKTH